MESREGMVRKLTEIRDAANQLLAQFGDAPAARRRGRPAGSKNAAPAPAADAPAAKGRRRGKKRTMSAAARKAIGDAQRKRWAKQKAAQK